MILKKAFYPAVSSILIFSISLISCAQQPGQTLNYDPSKNYAAFLVLNSQNSKDVLVGIKQRSISEGYEIGPIEYYNPGTKDFEPIIRKLTPDKQITLIWVAGSIMDSPDIQKAIARVEYKGGIRYMPVTGGPGQ